MLDQVFDVATQGIPSRSSALHQHDGWADERGKDEKDPLWPACLACAVVDRQAHFGCAEDGSVRDMLGAVLLELNFI